MFKIPDNRFNETYIHTPTTKLKSSRRVHVVFAAPRPAGLCHHSPVSSASPAPYCLGPDAADYLGAWRNEGLSRENPWTAHFQCWCFR
jgi:hypothetical protein